MVAEKGEYNMRSYVVKIVNSAEELVKAEKLYVNQFRQGTPGVEPVTSAQLVFLKGSGLLCRMESLETKLRAEVTRTDGDTYQDSCMEFFVNFNPDRGDEYINLEGNPIGTLHCKYGRDRYIRRTLESVGCTARPTAEAECFDGGWAIKYFIPVELIKTLFGRDNIGHGDIIKANFYKCGDLTDHPHFGMWNLVELEKLDFHRPDFFGTLILD